MKITDNVFPKLFFKKQTNKSKKKEKKEQLSDFMEIFVFFRGVIFATRKIFKIKKLRIKD